MQAFHNNPAIKRKYLARVRRHRAADQLVKGKYWENGKGCAVGCTIHGSDHVAYEAELGIPRELAYLEDQVFENLPNALAQVWPARFLAACPVGADLSLVWPAFAVWLLTDPTTGTASLCNPAGRVASAAVAALFQRQLDGGTVAVHEWQVARHAAAYAADAAYAATATAAAYAAADAAAYAADAAYAATATAAYAYAYAYAAADAAAAAAYPAARTDHWVLMSDKLIELLKAPPLPAEDTCAVLT